MLRSRQVVSKCRPVLQAVRPFFADRPVDSSSDGSPSKRGDYDATQQKQLVLQERPSLLNRWLDAGLIHLHRLLKFVTLRGSRASELYVRTMLEQEAGLDPFAVDFIALKHPAVLRLSWQNDIEPVVAWLGSKGIRGAELATIAAACPPILGKSVDEQLNPLADLVEEAGGALRDVLLHYPDLANVPIDYLGGARHVLRQLGASEAEVACLLLRYPDLYAQLARTLSNLFNTFGRFGYKAYNAERQQYAGVVLKEGWGSGSSGGDGRRGAAGSGADGAGPSAAAGSRREGRQLGLRPQQPKGQSRGQPGRKRDQGPPLGGEGQPGQGEEQGAALGSGELEVGTQETRYICDSDISQGLMRVQAALSALSMLQPAPGGSAEQAGEGGRGGPGSPKDVDAALSDLLYELDRLAQADGVCLRRDG